MNNFAVSSWQEVTQHLSVDQRWNQATEYLSQSEKSNGINLQILWKILDSAWDELLGENQNYYSNLSKFLHNYYQHPVWLINAAFSESDLETINDRMAAVRLITHVQPRKILDFGGGIGTVSRLCSMGIPYVEEIDLVDITEFGHTVRKHLSDFSNIRVLEKPDPPYDAVVSTEVLEHLIDPIEVVVTINSLLRVGGAFAASWSFEPCIKCHLPQNFHLKRLMPWIIRSLGFGFYGFERRGSTVYSFVKHSDITPKMVNKARLLELFSQLPLPLDRLLLFMRGI